MSRYRWAILAVGTAAQASFGAVAVGLPALAPALRTGYGLDLGRVGIVLGAVGLGSVATLLPWGLAADRVGERLVLALGLGGAAAALAAAGLTSSFAGLTAALVAAGSCGASVNAASGRAVMGWFGPAERGFALGIRQTANPLGGALAAAGLPWLAADGGTRLAFVALAAFCLAAALAGALWMREPAVEIHLAPAAVIAPVRDRGMWLLSVGSALYLVAQIAISGFLVLFLHVHRGLSPGAAAGVLAGTQALGGVARIVVGRWSDRVGARLAPLRLLGAALAAGMVLAAALVDAPLWGLVPAIVAAGVLGLAWNGLSFTAAAEAAGAARAGAALGFQQTVLGVAVATVPIGFAALVDGSSWRTAFALAALGPLLGLLLLRRVPDAGAATAAAGRRSDGRSPGTSGSRPAAP